MARSARTARGAAVRRRRWPGAHPARRGGRPSPDRPAGPGTRPRPARRSACRPPPPPPHRRWTGRCRAPVRTSAWLERAAQQVPQLGRRGAARGQRPDDRQGVDALDQVVAGRLAELRLRGGQVEHVVDDLEDHAEGVAEAGQRLDVGPVEPAHERADAGRGREQRRRLAADRLQVLGLGPGRAVGPAQLADLAVAEPADGVGQQRGDLRAQRGRDLRGPGQQEVTREDGLQVSPLGVDGLHARGGCRPRP